MGTYFGISAAGLLLAFCIHALYSATLPVGSSEPYPLFVQIAIGVCAFGAPIIALPISIFADVRKG